MNPNDPVKSEDQGDVRVVEHAGVCPSCNGPNGFHFIGCAVIAAGGEPEDLSSHADGEEVREPNVPTPNVLTQAFDEQKIPPTDDDIVSNEFMWLVAKVCHEVNRVYCSSIGDWSQPEWKDAPDWQRQSAYKGVTLHFEQPDTTPEESHKSWLAEKAADGWQYGAVKNEDTKTHPCFLPYNQLPPAQQYKDALFTAICRTMFGG